MPHSQQASDRLGLVLTEKSRIQAYQSAGLMRSAARLLNLASASTNHEDTSALIHAIYLTVAAALEALLLEAVSIQENHMYKKGGPHCFRKVGTLKKYCMLKKGQGSYSNEVKHLSNIRIAVAHGEPDNTRTRLVGKHLTIAEAQKAVDMLNIVARDIWGTAMPQWFRDATGLTP
jgi:hypothetical protein